MLKGEKKRYEIIDALRFFAAFYVVISHLIGAFTKHESFIYLFLGIDIFFIISGFVMMVSTQISSRHFFIKRIIRICPLYWGLTLVTFTIALIVPYLFENTTANFEHLFKSLFFIPFDKNGLGYFPILYVGWTLNYEMFFYLLFAIALIFHSEFRGIITSIFILCAIYAEENIY